MATFDDVVKLTEHLPGIEVSTWYGTLGLKVGGKGFCRLWGEREYRRHEIQDTEVLVVVFDKDEKSVLIDESNGVLFSTPHYHNHGGTLVRLTDVTLEDLAAYLLKACRHRAPAKFRREFDP